MRVIRLSRGARRRLARLTLDLTAIEEAAHRGDGPAYKLKDAMLSVQEHEANEGFRGAPRVMLALLVRLQELSQGTS
jgi:hypothetical protein